LEGWKMEDVNLVVICLNAFVAVLILLALLAFGMRLLTSLFPVPRTPSHVAVTAAISTAVATILPGARVTRIEELEGERKR